MSEEYNCDIIASNNTDFIVANNLTDGKVPVLLGGGNGPVPTDFNFNISDLLSENASFRTILKKTFNDISDLNKGEEFITEALNCIQNFLEEKLPQCDPEMIGERNACIFDGKSFKYMIENDFSMCAERSAMSQYICQKVGIKSHYINSQANVKNEKGLHTYLMYEDNGNMFVYDPNNPKSENKPRILDANMNKVIYKDFLEAVEFEKDSDDNKLKNRVGFKAKDVLSGDIFIYHSNCGVKGKTITPSKLKLKRMEKTQCKNGSSIEI